MLSPCGALAEMFRPDPTHPPFHTLGIDSGRFQHFWVSVCIMMLRVREVPTLLGFSWGLGRVGGVVGVQYCTSPHTRPVWSFLEAASFISSHCSFAEGLGAGLGSC